MNRVLVFGMTENPGGVESVIMNYYRHIDRNKLQFDFLCNSNTIAYEDEINSLGGNIYKITSRKENAFRFKRELETFMKKYAAKYIAIWVNICSLVNIDYLIAAKKYGIQRRIIHCHNSANDAGKIKKLIHLYNKCRLKKYATDYWSCSEKASPWFFDGKIIQSKKYRVIPNAINVEKFERNESVRLQVRKEMDLTDKLVIGHVGRFHFQKNHKFIIDIFEKLVEINEAYRLLLIGQGELENEVKQLAEHRHLCDKIFFAGARSDMERMYQAMDCFILPSMFEGLAVVALEAQAASLPCVFSDTVTRKAKINSNVTFVSLEKSAQEWAKVIDTYINEKIDTKDNKMGSSVFDIKIQAKNFERILLEE